MQAVEGASPQPASRLLRNVHRRGGVGSGGGGKDRGSHRLSTCSCTKPGPSMRNTRPPSLIALTSAQVDLELADEDDVGAQAPVRPRPRTLLHGGAHKDERLRLAIGAARAGRAGLNRGRNAACEVCEALLACWCGPPAAPRPGQVPTWRVGQLRMRSISAWRAAGSQPSQKACRWVAPRRWPSCTRRGFNRAQGGDEVSGSRGARCEGGEVVRRGGREVRGR